MVVRMKEVYSDSQLVKGLFLLLLMVLLVVLYWLGGGIPPWALREFVQLTPAAGQLWQQYGWAFLRPYGGLFFLSCALVLGLSVDVLLITRILAHIWEYRQDQQRFADDLRVAEKLAEAGLHQEQTRHSRRVRTSAPETEMLNPRELDVPDLLQESPISQPGEASVPPVFGSPRQQQLASRQISVAELIREEKPTLPVTEEMQELTEIDTKQLQIAFPAPAAAAPPQIQLSVGVGLDPGLARKDAPNEDTVLAVQGTRVVQGSTIPIGLFVVADGMGGHANGQEASRIASQVMSDVLVPVVMRSSDEGEVFSELLKEAVHKANLEIFKKNQARKVKEHEDKMGTTITAALVVEKTAYLVSVGDSRGYLWRPGQELQQITRDHSVVQRLVENGMLRPEDRRLHPFRNQIYRCLGEQASVDIDSYEIPLEDGDALLLCTDGLWEMLEDRAIQNCLKYAWPQANQMSSLLVQEALHQGGGDNIGLVVAVTNAEKTSAQPAQPQPVGNQQQWLL